MLGLIIDYYWYGTTQDPVQITVVGTLDELRATKRVDPLQVVDNWRRGEVIPVEQHNITSDLTGGILTAHICARHGTDFMRYLRLQEQDA